MSLRYCSGSSSSSSSSSSLKALRHGPPTRETLVSKSGHSSYIRV